MPEEEITETERTILNVQSKGHFLELHPITYGLHTMELLLVPTNKEEIESQNIIICQWERQPDQSERTSLMHGGVT